MGEGRGHQFPVCFLRGPHVNQWMSHRTSSVGVFSSQAASPCFYSANTRGAGARGRALASLGALGIAAVAQEPACLSLDSGFASSSTKVT